MNKLLLTIISLLICEIADAQHAYFATRGTISYDKITYSRARMRDMQQQMNQNNSSRMGGGRTFDLENIPESNTEKLVLEFDENTTLMYTDPNSQANASSSTRTQHMQGQAGQMRGARGGGGGGNISSMNVQGSFNARGVRPGNSSKMIFQNLKDLTSAVQVEIDDKYLITDSLNEITWRFSDEYRNIAGYECRRVNGSTKDSLYLIAFYTDELPLSAGPALTSGLPGMILGLVIPEMHIQYWATKVEFTNQVVKNDWKDKKAKSLALDEFVNSFGRFFQRGRDSNSSKRQVQEQLIY